MGGGSVPRARSYPDRLGDESGRAVEEPARAGTEQAGAGEATTDRQRAEFLAAVSHELRTPLTSIISFSELLRGEAGGLSTDGVRFLDIIERNADRLLRLIDDVLMLNRIEAGGLPLDLTEVSLPDLAADAVRSAGPAAGRSGVTLDLDTGRRAAGAGRPAAACPGAGQPGRQRCQVLARGRPGPDSAAVRGRYLAARRVRPGIGIPPDEAARLFGPFVRASNARIAGLPGTGLGLVIVKMLVEMHDGHVTLDSVLDQGTTVSVFLPVHETAAAP